MVDSSDQTACALSGQLLASCFHKALLLGLAFSGRGCQCCSSSLRAELRKCVHLREGQKTPSKLHYDFMSQYDGCHHFPRRDEHWLLFEWPEPLQNRHPVQKTWSSVPWPLFFESPNEFSLGVSEPYFYVPQSLEEQVLLETFQPCLDRTLCQLWDPRASRGVRINGSSLYFY